LPQIAHKAPYLVVLRNNLMMVAQKQLIHPVLCAWARMMGDTLQINTDRRSVPHSTYLLPRRAGSSIYPINDMALDAVEGVKQLLIHLDLWPTWNNTVQGKTSHPSLTAGSDQQAMNQSKIRTALQGQLCIKKKPVGTELLIENPQFLAESTLAVYSHDVPNKEEQYFAPFGPGYHASVYMQGQGQFFYVFHRGGPGSMEVHKLCCLTEDDVKLGCPLVFRIRPIAVTLGGFGKYTATRALYSRVDDDQLLVFMALVRPAMDKGSRDPPLHLYRCDKVPTAVQDIIDSKNFSDAHVRRGDPHWIREGLWSDGNWLWTKEKGWWEPIPRCGRWS